MLFIVWVRSYEDDAEEDDDEEEDEKPLIDNQLAVKQIRTDQ